MLYLFWKFSFLCHLSGLLDQWLIFGISKYLPDEVLNKIRRDNEFFSIIELVIHKFSRSCVNYFYKFLSLSPKLILAFIWNFGGVLFRFSFSFSSSFKDTLILIFHSFSVSLFRSIYNIIGLYYLRPSLKYVWVAYS